MFSSSLIETPDFKLSVHEQVSDQTAHEPDICLDEEGIPWVAWSARGADGDRIVLRRFDDSSPILTVSSELGIECQPALTIADDGSLFCAWAAHREGVWQILGRRIDRDSLGEENVIASSTEGAFRPRVLIRSTTTWVVYELVANRQSRVHVSVLRDGLWSQPRPVYVGSGDSFRPCIARLEDDDPVITFDRYENHHYTIVYTRLNQMDNPFDLSIGFERSVQSAIVSDRSAGTWIAWSSTSGNRDSNPWWLTKYATLWRFEDGELYQPQDKMPGWDLHNEDSFQGWEFPELAVDKYGRVWIFGQASHTLYAQYFSTTGWSERFVIDRKIWGSWKPRIRAVGSGPIFIASMGLGGAQVQRLDVRPPVERPAPSWPVEPVTRSQQAHTRSTVTALRDRRETGPTRLVDLNVYFGDLHAHSVYGDATGDVDEIYFRYRDAYGYDFAGVTEHDFLDGMRLSRSELARIWAAADRMTVEERFVAFYGYEWTSPAVADHAGKGGSVGEGHRHILYPDKSGPLVSYGDPISNTGRKLLSRLSGRRALVIPHHTAWSGTNLDAYDPELSRLVEICSTHGRFEYPGNRPIGYRRDHIHPGKYVVDALARGHRLGFVGGSDSHGLRWHGTEMEGRAAHVPAGTRVGWKEDAYRTGMTAILAPRLTREDLFDALYHRRCYATSGEPIVMDFQINGAPMGSEVRVETQPRIWAAVSSTAPLVALEIVRQGFVFESRRFAAGERPMEASFDLIDDLLIPGETQYYYARVTQEDGNMAWSSPIWVTYL